MIKERIKRFFNITVLTKEAFAESKTQILVLTFLSFLSGLLEGVGINALIPFFSFITGQESGQLDFITQFIKNLFSFFGVDFRLKYLLVFITLLFVLKAILLIFSNYIRARIGADYELEKRKELFKITLKAQWSFLLKQKLGHLENILSTDVRQGAIFLQMVSDMIMTTIGLLVYALIAFNISFYITLISVGLGALSLVFIRPLFKRTKLYAQQVSEVNKEIAHYINENTTGMKTIKAMAIVEPLVKTGNAYFKKLRNFRIRLLLIKNIVGSMIQPLSLIFICVVFAIAYKTPGFIFGAWVAVLYLIQKIFYYVEQLQITWHNLNECVPFLKNVLRYEKEVAESNETSRGSKPFKFNEELEFKDVGFYYQANKAVLSGVNFKIKKGEAVGLIGPSGAGKTTIVDLILRLFEPIEGQILLDGQDISEIDLALWRENLGYVSQDMFLVNSSISDNIRFYDDSISEQKIIEAAKLANIHEFIISCPEKYDTIVGERGVFLSAGQRQRVIIARVLVRQPKFLIFDEATSALDNESEVKIQQVVENLRGKISVLVIAHRLSTIINSDRLIVLADGQTKEQGEPRDLLKDKDTYFYKVYNIRE